jgi:cyclase
MSVFARCGRFIAAALFLSTAATAQIAELAKTEITIERLAGNVWVSQGTFTHATLSIGDDGVLLVDGVFSDSIEENGPILRRLTDEPLKFVVSTHCHSDHTSANAAYEGIALIVAHPNVRKRLSTGTVVCPKAALPDITINDELSIYVNDEEVRILSLPAGHTDSDLIVFFTKANVVHVGDLYVPPLGGPDLSNGGRFLGLIDALAFAIQALPADVTVIPAHGPKISMVELGRSHELLSEVAAFVERGVRRGETLAQLKGSTELAELRATPELAELDWLLEGIFAEVSRE